MGTDIYWIENALRSENYEDKKLVQKISKPEGSQSCHHFQIFKFLQLNSKPFYVERLSYENFFRIKILPILTIIYKTLDQMNFASFQLIKAN